MYTARNKELLLKCPGGAGEGEEEKHEQKVLSVYWGKTALQSVVKAVDSRK